MTSLYVSVCLSVCLYFVGLSCIFAYLLDMEHVSFSDHIDVTDRKGMRLLALLNLG